MKPFAAVFLLILIGFFGQTLWLTVLNLAGLPGISMPCGFVDGLPVGLQLIGPHFSEAKLLNAGHAYQQATDWHTHTPRGYA